MTDTERAEVPAQDRALQALADLLEALREESEEAFVFHYPKDRGTQTSCKTRARAVTQAIIALPSVTLDGASAKTRAARASVALALLPKDLVDELGLDMAADVLRLRGGEETRNA